MKWAPLSIITRICWFWGCGSIAGRWRVTRQKALPNVPNVRPRNQMSCQCSSIDAIAESMNPFYAEADSPVGQYVSNCVGRGPRHLSKSGNASGLCRTLQAPLDVDSEPVPLLSV